MFIVGVIDNDNFFISNLVMLLSNSNYNVRIIDSFSQFDCKGENLSQRFKEYEDAEVDIVLICTKNLCDNKEVLKNINFNLCIYIPNKYQISTENEVAQSQLLNLNSRKNYMIVDIDSLNSSTIIPDKDYFILTCGFNPKATITASSVDDNENSIIVCQQRSVVNIFDERVEPQEYIMYLKDIEQENIYNGLKTVATSIIFDVNKDIFAKNIM